MAKFNPGVTFADGNTISAATMNNIVGLLDIYTGVITEQTPIASVSTSDEILIADSDAGDSGAPNSVTVQKFLNDSLTAGTFTDLHITGNFTFGTTTGSRTVSTNASITTGTINNATLGTTTATAGTVTNLTAGTTTSTSANITNGTIQTLTSSTATITGGTFSGSVNATAGTIGTLTNTNLNSTTGTIGTLNSTTGTIGNFTTTLVGDVTISTGSATVGTRVSVVDTAQEYTRAHNFNATSLTITSGTIPWNLDENQVAKLEVTTNSTLNTPTNPVDGATYMLVVTQGTAGNNTLSFSTAYKFPGGTAPTLSVGSGDVDVIAFVSNGTLLYGVASQDFS